MHAHGFSIDLLNFFSCLKGRKRNDDKIETIKLKRIQYKSDKCSMEVRRLRTMAVEIFKSLNDLNPSFMKNLFNERNNINRRKNDLTIHT